MKEEEIRRLVKIVEESNIGELEISRWGRTIKISKSVGAAPPLNNSNLQAYQTPTPAPAPESALFLSESTETSASVKPARTDIEIKSPMVGTFYSAPAPDADPYIEVGRMVKKGQVLCIIEAMKLMNEIESEYGGKIVEILVENSQPVEYNQPLFMIELA